MMGYAILIPRQAEPAHMMRRGGVSRARFHPCKGEFVLARRGGGKAPSYTDGRLSDASPFLMRNELGLALGWQDRLIAEFVGHGPLVLSHHG